MSINKKEIEAVVCLDGPKRYSYFIKKAADNRKVYGLYNDGWAMAEDDDGKPVFLLWPEPEYAKLCADEDWSEMQPKEIELDLLFEKIIPTLRKDGILITVFPAQNASKGVIVEYDHLIRDLTDELSKIE